MLKISVLIWSYMIRLNICENSEIKHKSLCSVKHQTLGGHLHYHAVAASFHHLMKILLYHIRFRSRICRRNYFVSDDRLDRTDQTNLVSCVFQNRLYHVCGRRLSFCSCNSDCFQLFCRVAEIGGRNKRHRIACIFYKNYRNIFRRFCLFLHNESFRSLFDHIGDKLMSVHNSAPDTDKHGAFLCLSGIVGNGSHLPLHISLQACIFQMFQ